MTVAVGPLLDSVSVTLLDTARRTWPLLSDLVPWLNEALAATAALKPDMYTRQEYITLVAGVSQVIPADGVALLNVLYNAAGRVITQVDSELLDEANRFWPAATETVVVQHFSSDVRDPRRFNVTPPNDGTGSVQILYGAVPEVVTGSSGEDLPVSPNYGPILQNYVLGKAYAKNSKKQDLTKSAAYMNQWASMLGMKTKGQIAVAPRVAVSESNS